MLPRDYGTFPDSLPFRAEFSEFDLSIVFNRQVEVLPASVPFVGPETLERQSGAQFAARIGANESAFGISPIAQQAMADALGIQGCSWYGDPENHELRSELAKRHGIDAECICVDAGIDSLLGLTVRMLMEPGQNVVTSDGAYPTFNYHVTGFGGVLNKVPYNDNHEDAQGLLDAARAQATRLIYFSNPDNPMGTWHPASTVADMIANVPDGCTLLLDEAYIEFGDENTAPPIDTSNEHVIRYRTFSKAYGMAGMRIGYAIGHPDMITGFNKIRNHFGVNRLAQIAALASLKDTQFLNTVRSRVEAGRQRIYDFANRHSLEYLPSATNFVALDMQSSERATNLLSKLNKNGVFIRMPGVSPLNRYIRVGIGSEAEHKVFVSRFEKLSKLQPVE